jgi:diguanylate cyclase (GGDEF)-like protein
MINWLRNKSLRFRIIIFCSCLLIAVQSVSFYIINDTSLKYAEKQAKQSLESGSLVFDQLLDFHANQLVNASSVISSDFGFRQAVSSGDQRTILSVFESHGRRVGADIMMLVSLEGKLVANTAQTVGEKIPMAVQALISTAQQQGKSLENIVIDNRIFQAAVVPVFAPDIIGWLVLGFVIENELMEKLKALTNLQISLLKVTSDKITLPVSTISREGQSNLLSQFPTQDNVAAFVVGKAASAGDYFILIKELAHTENSRFYTVLKRRISDTHYHLSQLRNLLIGLVALSIIISVLGIVFIANSVTRPLRMLAEASEFISEGAYTKAADIAASGEIGKLANNFNIMQDSISSLIKLAYNDHLTGLPNRAMFNDTMEQAITLANENNKSFTLLFLDLNKFKEVNDTFGHEAGDRVLKTVSLRLTQSKRKVDVVARLGGDEFAVIIMTDDSVVVTNIMRNTYAEIEAVPINIGIKSVYVSCSIGAATFFEHAHNKKDLMHYADQAMYKDKELSQQGRPVDAGNSSI